MFILVKDFPSLQSVVPVEINYFSCLVSALLLVKYENPAAYCFSSVSLSFSGSQDQQLKTDTPKLAPTKMCLSHILSVFIRVSVWDVDN